MKIKGIGFDLFNTLIMAEPSALKKAMERLLGSLNDNGLNINKDEFMGFYKESARYFIKKADETGIETHNRFWISDALRKMGIFIEPNDSIINRGVEAYFSAFYDNCHLVPGTRDMLERISKTHTLGLVSNFTHAPAAMKLMEHLDISRYFQVTVISGEVGYRKPNPLIFRIFINTLNIDPQYMIYVGDDPMHDIQGAMGAGIMPVWMTYVRDNNLQFIPGYVRSRNEIVSEEVPRISTWEQLFEII